MLLQESLPTCSTYRKCGRANNIQKENVMKRASARHILVASKEVCETLKAEIEGGKDFATVAKENSLCPSKRDGGALGTFSPGQMVREFDEVVFTGEVGKVLGPVKTQFGYHLIEITSRTE
ncbi:MAG: peptidylprolyl isomerase [Geobacteraceae bacterium]|nr:peptidylprolyl isomerase [Geobacteraceae bacterium]